MWHFLGRASRDEFKGNLCSFLPVPAVSSENLRFSAKVCASQMPRGPKNQKNSRFRARLKFSSEPPTAAYFLWGIRDVEIEIFERD